MAANLARLESAAWPVFAAGNLPVIGEWIALPVLRSAGASPTEPLADQVLYPTADHAARPLRRREEEGEDIEVLELPFAEALAMTHDGRITDGKTILLLQWAPCADPSLGSRTSESPPSPDTPRKAERSISGTAQTASPK